MKSATAKFAELDGPMVKADGALGDVRKVVNAAYGVRIVLAEFLLSPTPENQRRLASEISLLTQDVDALAQSAGDMEFYAELKKTMPPAVARISEQAKQIVDIVKLRKTQFAAVASSMDATWIKLTEFARIAEADPQGPKRKAPIPFQWVRRWSASPLPSLPASA